MEIRDNYAMQAARAKQRFLSYDQEEIIRRCALQWDEDYFFARLLGTPYRIFRKSGDMQCFREGKWQTAIPLRRS